MSASAVISSAAIMTTHPFVADLISVAPHSIDAAAVVARTGATSTTATTSALVTRFRASTSATSLLALSSASAARFAFAIVLCVQGRDTEPEARCKREQSN